MSAQIIDGRKTRDELTKGLIERVGRLSSVPTLAIIQVGDRPDSTAFIKGKKAFAQKIGVLEKHIQTAENVSEEDLIKIVEDCNTDKNIQGIIVQLPLPPHIDKDLIIDIIDPRKDVDGLTATNIKRSFDSELTPSSKPIIMAATARGIRELLAYNKIELAGKKVLIIGRSMLVGKPIALMCLNANATVTIAHKQTADLVKETLNADIIISAAGVPNLVRRVHVNKGQVVIDVGISKKSDGKLTGDVDFASVSEVVSAITPVPGGVGPMTVLALFENLVDLCEK